MNLRNQEVRNETRYFKLLDTTHARHFAQQTENYDIFETFFAPVTSCNILHDGVAHPCAQFPRRVVPLVSAVTPVPLAPSVLRHLQYRRYWRLGTRYRLSGRDPLVQVPILVPITNSPIAGTRRQKLSPHIYYDPRDPALSSISSLVIIDITLWRGSSVFTEIYVTTRTITNAFEGISAMFLFSSEYSGAYYQAFGDIFAPNLISTYNVQNLLLRLKNDRKHFLRRCRLFPIPAENQQSTLECGADNHWGMLVPPVTALSSILCRQGCYGTQAGKW